MEIQGDRNGSNFMEIQSDGNGSKFMEKQVIEMVVTYGNTG